ncbi:MAG: glutamyl-tRNA reductase, partial [Gloeobacteraceae cyanobacterium ES-bin-316]|nr:glutamyl-tRNA reductase [Ferruginibacter sp.]
MPEHRQTDIASFFVAGINYKKTDADLRGHYAITKEQYAAMFALAPQYGLQEFFVISTCNRTEIFGFAENADLLCELLCSQSQGSLQKFKEIAYEHSGEDAIRHLFNVASGLDSQILGDYEIVGQLKQAAKFSKQHLFMGAYLERLVNAALQSSKSIKTNTSLSGGTVSVAFAAIQYIKEKVISLDGKKILLIGTGKIGRNTCKNLVDYLCTKDITLINRTADKAKQLAEELGLQFAPVEDLGLQVDKADIILVATNADEPVIFASQLAGKSNKIIIDLSIPFNVERSAAILSNVTLVNVDDLSKIKDATLYKRQTEVPKAIA